MMTVFEMLPVLQQMQYVLAKQNPKLTIKVDVDFTNAEGAQFLTLMAGLWNGDEFTKYEIESFYPEMIGADAFMKRVREFRAEVENWGAE